MQRTASLWVWVLVAVGFCLAACVDKRPREHKKKIDPAYIQQHLLSAPPSMSNPMEGGAGANFDNKVFYLGNNVSTDTITPGGKVTIDHYWKVVEPPGSDWRVFAHVLGASPKDWMNVDYTDMRAGYPPSKWKAGDIIHDEQKFALKKDWTSPYAEVVVGLYRKGGQGANARMKILSGPKDKESRLKVVRLKVDVTGKKSSVFVVRHTTGPIQIDGKADEADWKTAGESPDFTSAEGGPTVPGRAEARLLWDDQNLYVFAHVEDTDVASKYDKDDTEMWREDCVELFIDADRNRRGYVELQVNPHNAKFDKWIATTRAGASDLAWSAKMESAVQVQGTLDDRGDTDTGWDVEIAIPLVAAKGGDASMKVNIPPKVGDRWNLNMVRVEKPKKGGLAASSWNPITISDFHALDRMLTIEFGDTKGKIATPAATKPGSGTPASGAEGPASAEPAAPRGHVLQPSGPRIEKSRALKPSIKAKAPPKRAQQP